MSQAIDLARAPTLARHMRGRPLPRGVMAVIRTVSGRDGPPTAQAGHDAGFVLAAAEYYLREVVCFPEADPYRALGVSPDASRAEIRRHMREFLLWLHPDHGRGNEDADLLRRILVAWEAVNSSESVPYPAAGRPRRTVPYRPSWIPRPVPGPRARPFSGAGLRQILRLVVLIAGTLVTGLGSLALKGGLLRVPAGERGLRVADAPELSPGTGDATPARPDGVV